MDIIWESQVFFLLRTSMWEEKKKKTTTKRELSLLCMCYGWNEHFHLIAWSFILSIRFENRFMSTNWNEETHSLALYACCVCLCLCMWLRMHVWLDMCVCIRLAMCALKCVCVSVRASASVYGSLKWMSFFPFGNFSIASDFSGSFTTRCWWFEVLVFILWNVLNVS